MAVCNSTLCCVWPTLILLCMWMWKAGCDVQFKAEEEEIYHSDKQTTQGWNSEPLREWSEIQLRVGTQVSVPVLQACGRRTMRTILSKWMERKDAHYLLMDVAFAQEQEPESSQLSPLQVHLFDSDEPITRFQDGRKVLDLQTSNPIPASVHGLPANYLNRSLALSLGSVRHRGFQLAFSYSGTCVLVLSIRLYYRKCPDIVAHLALFKGTGAGSGPLTGSCVRGAVEVSQPVSECNVNGVWVPLQGLCTCEPGHQVIGETCQACLIGYYKPASKNGGCRLCPPNSRTHGEGSERCACLQGFSRLPTDPDDLGCTKPPSAPVNLTAHHHNDSVLILMWDPPHDWGGRQEVMYRAKCEKKAVSGSQWGSCRNDVVILPDSAGLTNTSVSITGLNPQCDYRLSVQAWNDISTLQGAPPLSTATVTIHRCM